MFICDDLAKLYVNLMNFGPVTPEFKKVVGVHLSLKNKSFETNNIISAIRIYLTDFHQIFIIGRYLTPFSR